MTALRKARDNAGLTLEDVTFQLRSRYGWRYSTSTLHRKETGPVEKVSDEMLGALATLYGVTVRDLDPSRPNFRRLADDLVRASACIAA